MNRLVLGVVLVLVLSVAYVLLRPDVPTQINTNTAMQRISPEATIDPEEASLREITIDAKNFSYNPQTITVKKGNKVRIYFKSSGDHDFALDEFDVKYLKAPKVKEGIQGTYTFTADKTGTFEYYCSIGNHRDMGMKGTLIVE